MQKKLDKPLVVYKLVTLRNYVHFNVAQKWMANQ